MPNYLFDSSAVLAILFKEVNPVELSVYLENSAISTINYSEVVSKVLGKGSPLEGTRQKILSIIEDVIPFDKYTAELTAELNLKTSRFGLSLADRACIATGIYRNYEIVTADRIWEKLQLPVKIRLIR